jgi:hypothetical protein
MANAPMFAAVVECDILAGSLTPQQRAAYFHNVEAARASLHLDLTNYEFQYRQRIGNVRRRLFQGDIVAGGPYRAVTIKFRRDYDCRVSQRLAEYTVEVQTILSNVMNLSSHDIAVMATELRAQLNQQEKDT